MEQPSYAPEIDRLANIYVRLEERAAQGGDVRGDAELVLARLRTVEARLRRAADSAGNIRVLVEALLAEPELLPEPSALEDHAEPPAGPGS